MLPLLTLDAGTWLDQTFHGFDYAIFEFFHSIQSGFMTALANFFTFFGDEMFVIPVLVIGIILCFFKKTRKYGFAIFISIVIGTLITNVVLKPLVFRARPYITMADDPFFTWYQNVGGLTESDRSFPSGHTTGAFEIAISLALCLKSDGKKAWSILPVVVAVMTGLSRIYLMVHYPTDVIGGVIAGLVAGVLGYFIAKAIMKSLEKGSNKLARGLNDLDAAQLLRKKQ